MTHELQASVDRYLRGETSGPIAAMELLLVTRDVEHILRAVPGLRGDAARILSLTNLVAEHAQGCTIIASMLKSELDTNEPASSVEEGIARARRLFDYAVGECEEASVALYSLGSPELLAAATKEAIDVLDRWGVLQGQRDALEIGCGIGRFLEPLAPHLSSLVGVDVSANMVAAARCRVEQRSNVRVLATSGRDLLDFASAAFDLVYSIDAFPYLVRAGRSLVATHFHEAARVLRQQGDFVIFNYAYGRPRPDDAQEVSELAEAAGLCVERLNEAPFRLWNGIAFHLKKR